MNAVFRRPPTDIKRAVSNGKKWDLISCLITISIWKTQWDYRNINILIPLDRTKYISRETHGRFYLAINSQKVDVQIPLMKKNSCTTVLWVCRSSAYSKKNFSALSK